MAAAMRSAEPPRALPQPVLRFLHFGAPWVGAHEFPGVQFAVREIALPHPLHVVAATQLLALWHPAVGRAKPRGTCGWARMWVCTS